MCQLGLQEVPFPPEAAANSVLRWRCQSIRDTHQNMARGQAIRKRRPASATYPLQSAMFPDILACMASPALVPMASSIGSSILSGRNGGGKGRGEHWRPSTTLRSVGSEPQLAVKRVTSPSPAPPPVIQVFSVNDGATSNSRGGHSLATSVGNANDTTRVRNMGRRLHSPRPAPRLAMSSSDPTLLVSGKAATWSPAPASPRTSAVEPKAPGLLRVPRRETVEASTPFPHDAFMISRKTLEAPVPHRQRPRSALTYSPSADQAKASSAASSATPSNSSRHASLAEETHERASALREPLGPPSPALVRSMYLMDSLYDLRRAGRPEMSVEMGIPDGNTVAEVEAATEEQDTLMNATLKDLDDTGEALSRTATVLENAHEPVHDLGGSRHATAVISNRTLAVVRRKRDLVSKAEARVASFEAAHAQREELLHVVKADDGALPAALQRVKRFILSHVHKDGEPVDADKSNFDIFASSFGLPREHCTLRRLRELTNEATTWWSEAALHEAQGGAHADEIRRLINVIKAISGERNFKGMDEIMEILGNRLSEKVLSSALTAQKRDAVAVRGSKMPQPESARDAASSIQSMIKESVALGAPSKHPSMCKAKAIEVELAKAYLDRMALRVLRQAESMQARDAEQAERQRPAIPDVGPASDFADAIDREISQVVTKHGVRSDHPQLIEARAVARALRDEDNQRKRLAARERRLAAKAGAAAAPVDPAPVAG